jgi:hypothetical protein
LSTIGLLEVSVNLRLSKKLSITAYSLQDNSAVNLVASNIIPIAAY